MYCMHKLSGKRNMNVQYLSNNDNTGRLKSAIIIKLKHGEFCVNIILDTKSVIWKVV